MESRVESSLYILETFSGHKANSIQVHCQLTPSQRETSCVRLFNRMLLRDVSDVVCILDLTREVACETFPSSSLSVFDE
jgi:hypothetical protein